MLKSCMQAAGYQKRDPTKGEVITGVALLPVSAPLCILAAIGGYNCLEEE